MTILADAGAEALARQRSAAAQSGRPLAPGERVDLNTASAAEIARLPRVGPGLARRIVSDRSTRGPFHTLADLDRVPGVGAGILRDLQPWVVQGGGAAAGGVGATAGPGAGGLLGVAPLPSAPPGPPAGAPVDLNLATEAELLRLPGIGPTRARAIVAYRQSRGSFASVEELVRVPGVGPATLARLAGLVQVR